MKLFECCMKCKAPKRYPGCHDNCEDYKKAKEIIAQRNKRRAESRDLEGYLSDKLSKYKNTGQY